MARRRPNPRAARQAFTIIELTIVLLIMGILAAVAAPRYRAALAHYRINAAAGRVAADLRMIRQYARRSSVLQTVTFNASTNSYAVTTMPDMNRPSTTYAVNLQTSDYAADVVTATFGSDAIVKFDIFGRPDSGGSVVLQCDDRQSTVVLGEAGDVSIQ